MSNRDDLSLLQACKQTLSKKDTKGERIIIVMAKDMVPVKENWEELGFRFTDIPGDDVLCIAKMPEGWSIRKSDYSMWIDIIDQNGLKRGTMFYKNTPYHKKAYMTLESRYKVCEDYTDNDQLKTIYFGNEQERLFVAGKVDLSHKLTWEEKLLMRFQEIKLKELARQFANENYPGWRNVNSYWNNEKDESNSRRLTI